MRWLLITILVMLGTASTAWASGSITDLGRPTNTLPLPPALLLDGFAKGGPFLKTGAKPDLLFIGTEVSGSGSAVELWALVKALDQFGRFNGVTAAETHNCQGTTAKTARCFSDNFPGYATFNLDHAHYSSRYVSLVHRDLIDADLHVHTDPTSAGVSLIQRYVRRYVATSSGSWADFAWQESVQPPEHHGLPLVSIGGYLRVGSGVAIPGDLTPATGVVPLSFTAVRNSLVYGKAMGGAPYSLVADVNAESNVLTALICHADRNQPRVVCTRAVVETVLMHMK